MDQIFSEDLGNQFQDALRQLSVSLPCQMDMVNLVEFALIRIEEMNTVTDEEINRADCAFDLLSRIKSTDQAEMIATVLFSYDALQKSEQPTEQSVYDHVMEWKPRWRGTKDTEVQAAICDLSSLGWMQPRQDTGLLDDDSLF